MSWHVDWQDGAALALALLGLCFAWWLRRRSPRPHDCARCPALRPPEPGGAGPEREPDRATETGSVPGQKISSAPRKT